MTGFEDEARLLVEGAGGRQRRREFLDRHADTVYAVLTEDLTRSLRLPELLDAAAERFPGLVPGRAAMTAEAGRRQAGKQGLEIDQGLFCGAVLGSPVAGNHLIRSMLRPTRPALDLLDDFRREQRADLAKVTIERRGPAAYVEFRNPGRLNAEDAELVADLDTAVDLALLDDDVRVGVLRGGPVGHPRYQGRRVFSSGIDLSDLRNGRIPYVDFLLGRELGYLSKILRGLASGVSKPWIGAVDTFAIGGGMQLLLVLDHVVAERQAYFSLPAAAEGIVPGLGNLRLTRAVGTRLARQVLLGGRRIAAATPEAALLCDEVVAPEEMDAAVQRAVRALAAPAVAANRHMLALAEEPIELFRTYLAAFAVVQAERFYAPDVLAKVERRWQDRELRNQAVA